MLPWQSTAFKTDPRVKRGDRDKKPFTRLQNIDEKKLPQLARNEVEVRPTRRRGKIGQA